jgi:hypothetical protein
LEEKILNTVEDEIEREKNNEQSETQEWIPN